jgi:hypothetical protein
MAQYHRPKHANCPCFIQLTKLISYQFGDVDFNLVLYGMDGASLDNASGSHIDSLTY